MVKPKRDKEKDKEPEPDYGEQHEAYMRPGETPRSNQVFSNIVAAQRALGERFNIEQIIDRVGLGDVDEKEGAYLQRRLRTERGIEFPENLRFDESILGDTKADPVVEDKPQVVNPDPTAEVAVAERARLVNDIFDTLRLDFDRAKKDLSGFSVETKIGKYREILGDDGVKQVLEQLTQAGITDLKEGGEEVKGEIHGRPPEPESRERKKLEFVRFEYKNGQLLVVEKNEGEDQEKRPHPVKGFDLPKEFEQIAKDPAKLERALKGLKKIYNETAPRDVKVMPLPRSWRKDTKITGFEVVFTKTRGADNVVLLPSDHILENVNAAIADTEKEGYWQAPGFGVWRDREKERVRKQYIQEQIRQGMEDLGIDLDAPEPAQPDEPEPAAAPEPQEKAEPDGVLSNPAGVMDDEILTPAEVGMSEETAERIRAQLKEDLIKAWARILASKYPKMANRGDTYVRNVAEDAMYETDTEDAFQKALAEYREWKKKK